MMKGGGKPKENMNPEIEFLWIKIGTGTGAVGLERD